MMRNGLPGSPKIMMARRARLSISSRRRHDRADGGGNGQAVNARLPPIIAQLIPRLASEYDGEVIGTARAIDRVLKSQGLDWHDFAAAVAPQAPPVQCNYEPRRTESGEAHRMRAWLTAISLADWPNEWTATFVGNL